MDIVSRKISLENFKPRVPCSLSYFDKFTDEITQVDYNVDLNGSYGKVVGGAVVGGKCISFPHIRFLYNFYRKYRNLLNYVGCDGDSKKFSSATELYEQYMELLPHGNEYYIGLDEEFNKYNREYPENEINRFFPTYIVNISPTTEEDSIIIKGVNNEQVEKIEYDYNSDSYSANFTLSNPYDGYYINNKVNDSFGSMIPSIMYWSDIVKWKSWFNSHSKDDEKCCVRKEWNERGGEAMLNWLNAQKPPTPINICSDCEEEFNNTNCLLVSFALTQSIDALGEESIAIEDWDYGEPYHNGDVVLFNDTAYKSTKDNNYNNYDKCLHEMFFDADNFVKNLMEFEEKPYETFCGNCPSPRLKDNFNPYNFKDYSEIISGTTESKLPNFKDTILTIDSLGNVMHGIFVPSENEVNPKNGTILDLQYHPYNVNDMSPTEEIYVVNGEKYYKNFGNVLTKIEVYLKQDDGERINVSTLSNINDKPIESIKRLFETLKTSTNTLLDGKVYACFYYSIGVTLKHNGKHYVIDNDDNCVKYEDEKYLVEREENYMLGGDKSVIVKYYELVASIEQETRLSHNQDTTYREDIAKFTYKPLGDANNSNVLQSPTLRQEYKLGITTPPKINADIYVQRGLSSAFEKHLALGSVKTFEALENYSNGFFTIVNNNNANG